MYQKKTWTSEEDSIIRTAVKQMGDRPRWKPIAQSLNKLKSNAESQNIRTAKQCRQRWHNKLDPQILDKQWDQEQINNLFYLHNEYGNKWSLIATMMSGRTDNCVKNKFYSTLRKGMRKTNKFIVNLKRKLLQNKNTCIKEFNDVVLTKLIAVADKKYDQKLDVKENSRYKTQNLSEAIKLALVKLSKNDDDYVGHVKNGVADDTYDVEETLFKNIQEFCRNCKRKKGKRKSDDDDDLQEGVSEMVDESEELQQKESEQKKLSGECVEKLSLIEPLNRKTNKISKQTLFEEEKHNQLPVKNIFEDQSQVPMTSQKEIFELNKLTNFTKVNPEPAKNQFKETYESRLAKLQSRQNEAIQSFCFEKPYQSPVLSFFENIRCVEFQRTDHNGKIMKDFKPQYIFKQGNVSQQLQTSQNQFSLSSSNQFSLIEKSQSFLNLCRSIDGIHDPNQPMYVSSSLSSNENKQHEKLMEFFHSKSQRKDEIQASQAFARSLNFNDSIQLSDLFKRMSENKD